MRLTVRRALAVIVCAVVSVVIVINVGTLSAWRDGKRTPELPWDDATLRTAALAAAAVAPRDVRPLTYLLPPPADVGNHVLSYMPNPLAADVISIENDTSRLSQLLVWPHQSDSDRIPEQMNYAPRAKPSDAHLKTIYVQTGLKYWNVAAGRHVFQEQKCRVDTCRVTDSRHDAGDPAAVLFRNHYSAHAMTAFRRTPSQVWIWYQLECPYHSQWLGKMSGVFNWTATYRHDSDIVAPYERYQPYDARVLTLPLRRNFAANKTKKVAWFVSNCGSRNNRLGYATELGQHIQVDIYGSCGPKKCARRKHGECVKMLNVDYKFYLSFENSNCKDYITEKFFDTGLRNDIVPIVMGASKEDYTRAAPYYSFIHVDDFAGPAELAAYLRKLDANDTLYNEYFQWKGTGTFVNTYFWCRMCAMLHYPTKTKWYEDINDWWRGQGTCVKGKWSDGGDGAGLDVPY
ncbi:PREDICTED: glycoprotein 3-alpha-L-fucosyltransferase A-like [Priapulus caudatus]|uniref:Fucosyltransferase n=1 Tax=Priapulus caudatus TaxID=37621 RepID=A0ABM1FBM1_PRICU|nr:PREDICTED: glycoprotein 3-alpha-L-fucosyltransferase A-like [Priapulus caudatus]